MSILFDTCIFLSLAIQVVAYTGSRTYEEIHDVDAWVIVVGNIAGVAVIIIFIVICCCAMRRRSLQQQQQGHAFVVQYPPTAGQPGVAYTEPPPPYTAVNAGYEHSHDDKAHTNGTPMRPNDMVQNPYPAHHGVILSPQNAKSYNTGTSTKQNPAGMQRYLADGYNYGTQI